MTNRPLESGKRLSKSILWELQHKAYCQYGIEAWSQHGVPSYLTSNSFTARAYAQIVLGYLRDCIFASALDLDSPVYLLDLGAGTGRFGYLFLRELLQLLDAAHLPKIKVCYVMTDIASRNVEYWEQHPYLKPFLKQGILDRAYYYHAQSKPITLIGRNETLSEEALVNPIVLICNYFFDTIPQDLFRISESRLEEGRITLSMKGKKPEFVDPFIINDLEYRYTYKRISHSKQYYGNTVLDEMLASYCKEYEGCPFLFPVGAFQVLQQWFKWSGSRLLLLAGDQGVGTPDQMHGASEPKLSLHGSFSFPVNYYVIADYFKRCRGKAWLTTYSDPKFIVMAGEIGLNSPKETALAFRGYVDAFEPVDYFRLVSLTEEHCKEPSLDQILLLIKLGNWDPSVLLSFFHALRRAIASANESQKQLLCAAIDKVWENFYPIDPSTGNFVLNLGVLLFEMKRYEEAITYFYRSMTIAGVNETALKNIAACHQIMRKD